MKNETNLDAIFRKISFNDDKDAFKELFYDFYPSLCVFAQRYISSPETCEDIVQDIFFNVWKNRKKINVTVSFRNFLITSLKNSCVDYLRKQSVRQTHMNISSFNEPADSPYELYTINELEQMLQKALESMSPNVRKAFELSRFENMTYSKISEEMDVAQKTVEAYISQALRVLRIELKDYLPLLIFLLSGK